MERGREREGESGQGRERERGEREGEGGTLTVTFFLPTRENAMTDRAVSPLKDGMEDLHVSSLDSDRSAVAPAGWLPRGAGAQVSGIGEGGGR